MKKTERTNGPAEPRKLNPKRGTGDIRVKLIYSVFPSKGPIISGSDSFGRRLKWSE